MKRSILITLSLLMMILAGSEYTFAQKSSSSSSSSRSSSSRSGSSKSSSSKSPSSNHNNNNSSMKYSKDRVTVVKSSKPKSATRLPSKSVALRHKGSNYYRNGSKYYKMVGGRYLLTPPPFGLRVSIIPALHTAFLFNNINYYCSEGVIYTATEDDQYEVVEPVVGMIVPELPEVNVREVSIDGTIYFEFEETLYKQIPTASGVQYKVVGNLVD